ncbi:MAG: glycosyltransferase family 4 protein [Candidatus Puniceispirillales bacterium]
MKIYLSKINEDWIIDRVKKEWLENNKDISTKYLYNSDLIWIISPWLWRKIPLYFLKNKKVICSIYHVDNPEEKITGIENFDELNSLTDQFHVISENTLRDLKQITDKKITSIPFWINDEIFYPLPNKNQIRDKYNVNKSDFVIGSFQRDSEGSDLSKPKLIKGPDRLIEIYKYYKSIYPNLTILLTGKRRDYIINELRKEKINFIYKEMVNFDELNELYNCLDLYIVASRKEGGPQAILECGITETPILSTDVGIASEILSPESIFTMSNFQDAKPNVNWALKNTKKHTIPHSFENFKKMFNSV